MVVLGGVELCYVEVDGSIRLVGKTFFDDFLDERNVLRNVLTHSSQTIGWQNLEKKPKKCETIESDQFLK